MFHYMIFTSGNSNEQIKFVKSSTHDVKFILIEKIMVIKYQTDES